ncbi:MAG: ABC transporter ATP-binding protein, partial [Eubacteriales bacterium]
HALNGISLSIDDGEFLAIIGPSGSGKSTLMNVIGCLDVAEEGTYKLDGEYVRNLSERQLGIIRNEKIGFIFQQFNLLPKLTAYENVELPLVYQGLSKEERKKRTEESLEKVGLADRMDHKPTELSGGQQQRVAIARALGTHPTLILADEPTGNLDSKSGKEIMQMLKALNKEGRGVVLITHDSWVANQADRQVRIVDGQIVPNKKKKGSAQ